MSDLDRPQPTGILRVGWSTTVADYAIAGDWALGGDILVVCDAAGGVYGLEGKSGNLIWSRPEAHEGGVLAMAVRPDGATVATTGQDGRMMLWKTVDGEMANVVELGDGWVENVAWSSDGRRLAASISRRVHVYGADGEAVWQSEEHPSTVSAIAWSGTQELATACYGRVAFFDTESGKSRQTLEWKGSLVSMVLRPDGDIVACGSQDNSVHFWRRSTSNDSMMSGYPGKPSALAFDSTGTLLATGGGQEVTVWSFAGDGPEGTHPGQLDLHVSPLAKLAFARRGMLLASGDRTGGVVIWKLRSDGQGDVVGAAVVADGVAELAWRPDGRSLAALDGQGGVTAWHVQR